MLERTNENYDYVGYGFAYPLKVNLQGGIELSTGKSNIEESITIILRTNLGERLYRPNFGCRLPELAFEPVNSEILLLARMYVEEAIGTWEPRIIVKEVRAEANIEKNLINITLTYQIKNTRDIRSMIYPFYLTPEKDLPSKNS